MLRTISVRRKNTPRQSRQVQHFCYRGYVYDQECNLYYLQSRYYDPKVGRFLNRDVVYDLDAGLQGYNLFVYCGNNPVRRVDISGADSVDMIDGDEDTDEPQVKDGGCGRSHRFSSPPGNPSGNGNTAQSINTHNPTVPSTPNHNRLGKIVDILKGAVNNTAKKGITTNFQKSGGYDQATADFEYIDPSNTKTIDTQYGDGLQGTYNNISVILRRGSTSGGATLEFRISSRYVIKVRY